MPPDEQKARDLICLFGSTDLTADFVYDPDANTGFPEDGKDRRKFARRFKADLEEELERLQFEPAHRAIDISELFHDGLTVVHVKVSWENPHHAPRYLHLLGTMFIGSTRGKDGFSVYSSGFMFEGNLDRAEFVEDRIGYSNWYRKWLESMRGTS
jgi:hypothetical protein